MAADALQGLAVAAGGGGVPPPETKAARKVLDGYRARSRVCLRMLTPEKEHHEEQNARPDVQRGSAPGFLPIA
ncbi:hypothetical protein AB0M95_34060 [Sphaerisporangium sp. NPDC051017]|uniref:hypothetical protein n=1 Tax=Sphaerisporangium sp. NPDC051017 TaxID=3154636 RepID=UPI00342BF381